MDTDQECSMELDDFSPNCSEDSRSEKTSAFPTLLLLRIFHVHREIAATIAPATIGTIITRILVAELPLPAFLHGKLSVQVCETLLLFSSHLYETEGWFGLWPK